MGPKVTIGYVETPPVFFVAARVGKRFTKRFLKLKFLRAIFAGDSLRITTFWGDEMGLKNISCPNFCSQLAHYSSTHCAASR